MDAHNEQSPGSLERTIKFIGSIAGILAVVSAVESLSGFIVLHSNASLLGLSSFLHHSVSDYLYVGGEFFLKTFFLAGQVLLTQLTPYLWLLIIAITLYLLLKFLTPVSMFITKVSGFLTKTLQEPLAQWVCFLIALYLLSRWLMVLAPQSDASNLLFPLGNSNEVAKRASEQSLADLVSLYRLQVLCVLLSGLVVAIISRIIRSPRKKAEQKDMLRTAWWAGETQAGQQLKTTSINLFYNDQSSSAAATHPDVKRNSKYLLTAGKVFLYFLFVVELFLLPINYGQNVYSNEFHKICVTLDPRVQSTFPRSDNLWLIRDDPNDYTVYYGDSQEIRIFPKKDLLSISINQRANIFGKQDPHEDQLRCEQ